MSRVYMDLPSCEKTSGGNGWKSKYQKRETKGAYIDRLNTHSINLLANLAGNIWLQAPGEDLVYDAITVIWIVGLFPIVISCKEQAT